MLRDTLHKEAQTHQDYGSNVMAARSVDYTCDQKTIYHNVQ